MSMLDSLKRFTTVVADTGTSTRSPPTTADATTNPSLLIKLRRNNQHLVKRRFTTLLAFPAIKLRRRKRSSTHS